MKPSDLEKELQKNAKSVAKRLLSLTKARDKALALRAVNLYLSRAYGNTANTDHDPFANNKNNKKLQKLIAETIGEKSKDEKDEGK